MSEIIKQLDITSLIHGGRGIGRHDGKAVFVPMTVPGDRVACRIVRSRRRYVEAELLEIITHSAQRREPPCPFFGSCGGCQWQHIDYREQVRCKEQIFGDLLIRSKLVSADRLNPVVPAPDEWNYRNRAQFKCRMTADGLVVGFYRQNSHDVVNIDVCRLVDPRIQKTLDLFRNESPSVPCPDSVLGIDIACGDDGGIRITLHVLPQGERQILDWLKNFAGRHQINACMRSERKDNIEVVHGEVDLIIRIDRPEITLRYGPGGFVQVNSSQNRNMVAGILELLTLDGTETVLDLFCGMGNFSLPLARRAGRVVGVEDHVPSIISARINAAANNICNAEFYAADASSIKDLFHSGDDLDLVIIDPPRTGNYQVSLELLKLRPTKVLYVSCDPATLVRDLAPLVQGGYEVVSSQPFDLFPQTWHIESMTLLRKAETDKRSE